MVSKQKRLFFFEGSPEFDELLPHIEKDDSEYLKKLANNGILRSKHETGALIGNNSANTYYIIRNIVKLGASKCLGAILPILDRHDISFVIYLCLAEENRMDLFKQSIPFYDMDTDDSQALFLAVHYEKWEAFDLLLPLSLSSLAKEAQREYLSRGGFSPFSLKSIFEEREKAGTWESSPENELMEAAISGDIEKTDRLLSCGVDPRTARSAALFYAARNGHADCVNLLMHASHEERICKENQTDALSAALSGDTENHIECFNLLVKFKKKEHTDSTTHHLAMAAQLHHENSLFNDVIERLIELSDIEKTCEEMEGRHEYEYVSTLREAEQRLKSRNETQLLKGKYPDETLGNRKNTCI